jgi:hypothetical protein
MLCNKAGNALAALGASQTMPQLRWTEAAPAPDAVHVLVDSELAVPG